MTAINPARLKIQSARLAESFQNLEQFIAELHELLFFYAARIRQTTLSRTPLELQAYQVPAPVLRALELELADPVNNFPVESLSLVDLLWNEDWLECRQLGVNLLGLVPTSFSKDIIERIKLWVKKSPTEDLRQQIMIRGLQRMLIEEQNQVMDLLKYLGASADKKDRQGALFGLLPFAEDPDYVNLPEIFTVLSDILLTEEPALMKEITTLIRSLKIRSDQETANFLIRQLATASKPRIFRTIRQVMGEFSEDSQSLLREGLENYT